MPDDVPREILTMVAHMPFYQIGSCDYLKDMMRDDPEMLNLIIGIVFRFDPWHGRLRSQAS